MWVHVTVDINGKILVKFIYRLCYTYITKGLLFFLLVYFLNILISVDTLFSRNSTYCCYKHYARIMTWIFVVLHALFELCLR